MPGKLGPHLNVYTHSNLDPVFPANIKVSIDVTFNKGINHLFTQKRSLIVY